jgi:hypothetical protein
MAPSGLRLVGITDSVEGADPHLGGWHVIKRFPLPAALVLTLLTEGKIGSGVVASMHACALPAGSWRSAEIHPTFTPSKRAMTT